jgi:DnaJ-domain-containing protein 1
VVSNGLNAYKFANALADYVDFLVGRMKSSTSSSKERSNSEYSYTNQAAHQRTRSESSHQNTSTASQSNTRNASQRAASEPAGRNKEQSKSSNSSSSQQSSSQRKQNERQPESGNATDTTDPFAVLKVSRQATKDEISAAYRKLVQQYHPDKVAHLGQEFQMLAEQKMREINAAYDQLKRS